MLPQWVTATVVACAILHGDNNIHREPNAESIARVEADAFISVVSPETPIQLLLAIGYVESRFNPNGSQYDRDHGVWGIMQIMEQSTRCFRHGRRRGAEHDDPAYCTPEQMEMRNRLLDPAWNIRQGARMLHRAYRFARGNHVRQRASAGYNWTGAYFWGGVPRRRRDTRRYYNYAASVTRAVSRMQHQLFWCRNSQIN